MEDSAGLDGCRNTSTDSNVASSSGNKKVKFTTGDYEPGCSIEASKKNDNPVEDKTMVAIERSPKPTLGATLHLSAISGRRKTAILVVAETFAKLNHKAIICECMIEEADKFLAKHGAELTSLNCDWSCNNSMYCHELI